MNGSRDPALARPVRDPAGRDVPGCAWRARRVLLAP